MSPKLYPISPPPWLRVATTSPEANDCLISPGALFGPKPFVPTRPPTVPSEITWAVLDERVIVPPLKPASPPVPEALVAVMTPAVCDEVIVPSLYPAKLPNCVVLTLPSTVRLRTTPVGPRYANSPDDSDNLRLEIVCPIPSNCPE